MAVQVGKKEIEDLGAKLESFAKDLPKAERDVLGWVLEKAATSRESTRPNWRERIDKGGEVTLVTVDSEGADNGSIGEIDVMSDGGERICKIFMNQDGSFDTTDCQR